MSLHTVIQRSEKFVADNSPLILTGIGAAGVLTTAYLTGKASFRIGDLHRMDEVWSKNPITRKVTYYQQADLQDKKVFAKWAWPFFVPAAGAALTTIAAIILANRIGTRRAAAMAAAYTVAERGFQEYREKVQETIGKKKETEIRDAVAQDQVARAGIHSNMVIIGTGDSIFVDARTMRPFMSTMQDVKKAINDVNWKINTSVYASVNDWYDKVGLPRVPDGDDFGWSNVMLDPHITTTITDDEKPAFLITFTAEPVRGYHKIHP